MNNIILLGYRCTGKTSVGRTVAEKLKVPFYDTDQMITDHLGKTIKAWVEEKGWASFREEEKKVIQGLFAQEPGVISLGGGAVLDPENRETIQQMGRIIWLKANIQTIMDRMKSDPQNQDKRPALSDKGWETEIEDLLIQRSPVYRQLANFYIDTEGKTVEEVTVEVLNQIRTQGIR
jgi:shikimate kinase